MILTELFLASLAMAPALALPAAPTQGEIFSFGNWIDGIIANPDGNNLTPDEAVAAWRASSNETHAGGALETRADLRCMSGNWCQVRTTITTSSL
jgi:hypothetical protein